MIVDRESKQVFKPENWKEYFKITFSDVLWRHVDEGQIMPRWYIPVRRDICRLSVECWIFPLSIFVWFYYLFSNIFHTIWFDAFQWNELVSEWREKKYNTYLPKNVLKKIDNMIAEEIVIAQQEGQSTSRLTSLAVKISELKDCK